LICEWSIILDISQIIFILDGNTFQRRVIKVGIRGNFWNLLYDYPWTIPKTISKITTSFSSLIASI
jgi:hypothetical protein